MAALRRNVEYGEYWEVPGGKILQIFSPWAVDQRKAGVRLIILEGPPDSGKSWIVQNFRHKEIKGFELDSLLRNPASPDVSWVTQVTNAGAVEHIRAALDELDCMIVEGPAVWPAIEPLVEQLGRPVVRRFYMIAVQAGGGIVDPVPVQELRDEAKIREQFWRSIDEHHGCDKPWLDADLKVARVPED